jgi:hypothetical protein
MAISWKTDVGVNHVGAYQVSGRPFASGSIDASEAVKVEFPKVTRWIYVVNHDAGSGNHCRIGFSQAGVEGTNFFSLGPQAANEGTQSTVRLEVKVGEIWLSGSGDVDVMAGLTNISTDKVSGSIGPSWSGSAGVG